LLPAQKDPRDQATQLPSGKPALPEELVRMILYHAEYFDRLSISKEAFAQCVQRTGWQPYLESKPVPRKLPRVDIQVTGHDQGWAGDRSASYSFYDLGSMSGTAASEIIRGPRLFDNIPANREKQVSLLRSPYWSTCRLIITSTRRLIKRPSTQIPPPTMRLSGGWLRW